MRPERKRISSTREVPDNPAYLAMPNGSEVYEKDSRRLKGYTVRLGRDHYEAYDAKRQSLGIGSHVDCLAMLNTTRAVRVASEVFLGDTPKRRG